MSLPMIKLHCCRIFCMSFLYLSVGSLGSKVNFWQLGMHELYLNMHQIL